MSTPTDDTIFQCVVRDPGTLSGTSVASFTSRTIDLVGATMIGIADLVGSLGDLRKWNGQMLQVDQFLNLTRMAVQFDWAFFFLYTRQPSTKTVPDPKTAMANADVTIRLVDDQFFYVYARSKTIIEGLHRLYPDAECSTENFKRLVIPS